jgi:predicted ATPase
MEYSVTQFPKVIFEPRIRHPSCIQISGSSGAGKSTLTIALLLRGIRAFTIQFKVIIIVYSHYQKLYDELKEKSKAKVVFITLEELNLESLLSNYAHSDACIVFDDAITTIVDDIRFLQLTTRDSHHRSITIIILLQTIFIKSKYSRAISLNCQYKILLNNCGDRLALDTLNRQLFPHSKHLFINIFRTMKDTRHNYILIDCHSESVPAFSLRSNLLSDIQTVFVPTE